MSLRLLMDVHVPRSVTEGLRRRGVDVLTAQEDGAAELTDPALLRRATALGRVLFSQDVDLLREAALLQRHGEDFCGGYFCRSACGNGGAVRARSRTDREGL